MNNASRALRAFINGLVLILSIAGTCFVLEFLLQDDGELLDFAAAVMLACFLSLFCCVFYAIDETKEVKKELSNLKNKIDEIQRDLQRKG